MLYQGAYVFPDGTEGSLTGEDLTLAGAGLVQYSPLEKYKDNDKKVARLKVFLGLQKTAVLDREWAVPDQEFKKRDGNNTCK